MNIQLDDPGRRDVRQLLVEHLRDMAAHSPPESVHALDVAGLAAPEVTFWTVREGKALLGCGALKELDRTHGEIKSMRTARAHLRRGVARLLLDHVLAEARRRGYRRVSLETGSPAAFAPARRLYCRAGFTQCDPFGPYTHDLYSVYMTRTL